MLTSFALEPEAVRAGSEANASILAQHHQFLQKWSHLGVFVRPYDDEDGLIEIVKALPQRFRTRWQKVLKHARTSRGPDGWQGLKDIENESNINSLREHINLAIVDEATATLYLEIPEAEHNRMLAPSGIEVCKFNSVSLSDTFFRAESTARDDIRQGERISDVWNQRFRSLAKYARHVAIVDRYALTDGPGLSGFERFVKELDGNCDKASLTVYSSAFNARDVDQASAAVVALRKQLSRGGVQGIFLYLIPDRRFELIHDRYIRFDHSVCELGEGVSVMGSRNGRVYRSCSFNFKNLLPSHREKEKMLGQECVEGCPFSC